MIKKIIGFLLLTNICFGQCEFTDLYVDEDYQASYSESKYTDMEIDGNGIPYIIYTSQKDYNKAVVRRYFNSQWETVGNGPASDDVAINTSIKIGTNGVLYITYQSYYDRQVYVKKFNGGSWETLGGIITGSDDNPSSLGLDNNNIPYIAHRLGSSSLYLKKLENNVWTNQGTYFATSGTNLSLVFDQNNNPYIAYTDFSNSGKCTVKTYDGANWSTLGTAGFTPLACDLKSLIIGTNSKPCLVYRNTTNRKLNALSYDGSTWNPIGTLGISPGKSDYPAILNKQGVLYASYVDIDNNTQYKLTCKSFDGSNWIDVVPPRISPYTFRYISLGATSTGDLFIAYSEAGNLNKAVVKNTTTETGIIYLLMESAIQR